MKFLAAFLICVFSIVPALAQSQSASNQCANASMEGEAGPEGLPAHWMKFVKGVPATFAIDTQEKHSGQQSIRMEAKESARSFVWSDKIPVAPGEKIHASCWMKLKDFKAGSKGPIVRIIAQFTEPNGSMETVKLVADADSKKTDWQLVKGTIEVPETCLAMRLQIGYSYCWGTVWLDDASIQPEKPLVARADVGARLPVASGTIPVTIINRAGEKTPVRVVTSLTKNVKPATTAPTKVIPPQDEITTDVTLDGSLTQKIQVPVKITRRDEEKLEVAIYKAGEKKPLYVQTTETLVPPPLMLTPTIPTHWCVEDGTPNIEGDVEIAIPNSERDGSKLTIKLTDPTGAAKATVVIEKPADGMNHYAMKLPEMPQGTYRMLADLERTGQETARNQQPFTVFERKFAKVTLNEAGYPVYNGRAIFPLGIFNGSHFEEQGKAGFTVAHGYNAFNASPTGPNMDNVTKRFMDEAAMNGMKTIFLIPRGIAQAGDWAAFRRRIRMFKNHPGLLAWDEEEEVARGNVKPEVLDTICKIIREEDPNHPIMVGDSHDVISRIAKDRSNFFRDDLMDLGMWWWYPIPLGGKDDDALLGVEKTQALEMKPPGFLTNYHGPHPLWIGLQSYKHEQQPDARFPNPTEYRLQAYLGIIEGGKGLMYYGGSIPNGMFAWDEKHKKWLTEEANWEYVQKLATELKGLFDVFMSPNSEAPKVSPENALISICLKNSPRGLVILAANRNGKAVDVTISSPQIKVGPVKIPTENREIPSSAGRFNDHFDAYGVHVYELP